MFFSGIHAYKVHIKHIRTVAYERQGKTVSYAGYIYVYIFLHLHICTLYTMYTLYTYIQYILHLYMIYYLCLLCIYDLYKDMI